MTVPLELLRADYIADGRAMTCPGPLLLTKRSIDRVDVGQILEVQVTDQGAREDLPAWAKKSGNEYIGSLAREGFESHFLLRRK